MNARIRRVGTRVEWLISFHFFHIIAAHILIGGLRRTLLHLPLSVRGGVVKRILGLSSERRARKIMYQMTHPYGYQWDWITPVTTKNGARGYWVGKDIKENGGTPYAEETAKNLDLVFYYIHGKKIWISFQNDN